MAGLTSEAARLANEVEAAAAAAAAAGGGGDGASDGALAAVRAIVEATQRNLRLQAASLAAVASRRSGAPAAGGTG